jgi:starch phosphorylase
MSLIDEGNGRRVRMAHLAIVGSHQVNGVSQIHTDLMKKTIFAEFEHFYPGRIINITNGVTPRRWLHQANPKLSELITGHITEAWVGDLSELKKLAPLSGDPEFRRRFRDVKRANKERLGDIIRMRLKLVVDPASLFDVQVKRIHEYKRQLMNVLQVVTRYNRIREGRIQDPVPRTVIFAGKAAPGYAMAKLIIKLIHCVGDVVNNDPSIDNLLKVVFIPDYNVSNAEKIIPACDLSEQISTAGTEASGTGNMKFALNGALTIGTLDGANVEIREEVGEENFFLFGLTAAEVAERKARDYDPRELYRANLQLRGALDLIGSGALSPAQPDLFAPLVASLLERDPYMLLEDFDSYLSCQQRVAAAYRDQEAWTRMSILNVARMGRFSSDRTIREYAEQIWGVRPAPVRRS